MSAEEKPDAIADALIDAMISGTGYVRLVFDGKTITKERIDPAKVRIADDDD